MALLLVSSFCAQVWPKSRCGRKEKITADCSRKDLEEAEAKTERFACRKKVRNAFLLPACFVLTSKGLWFALKRCPNELMWKMKARTVFCVPAALILKELHWRNPAQAHTDTVSVHRLEVECTFYSFSECQNFICVSVITCRHVVDWIFRQKKDVRF